MNLHLNEKTALVTGSSAVTFLASPAADVITGSALRVEGGLLRGIL